jgi:hypothetical protein
MRGEEAHGGWEGGGGSAENPIAMEASTSADRDLLARDGDVLAAPTVNGPDDSETAHPIDGVARCRCCSRFPLVGEIVVRHRGRNGTGWACESCERQGRGAQLGPVVETERIRSLGGAMNVRPTR